MMGVLGSKAVFDCLDWEGDTVHIDVLLPGYLPVNDWRVVVPQPWSRRF